MKLAAVAALLLASTLLSSAPAQAQRYNQVNLVSDLPDQALHQDTNLRNPWGLVPGPSGVFWSSNNGTSTSTLYDPDGTIRSLVVNIPGGAPTGVVLAAATDSSFRIPSADSTARAIFIFVTESGTVAAWAPTVNQTNAIQVASVADAKYTGVAIGGAAATPHLYAANFHSASIDVFDRDFHHVTLSGTFADPNLPANYTPFNVANIGGQLYVAYAQTADFDDETQGAGLGLVDVFDLNGNFVERLISPGGSLNAPWGMVVAPSGFGTFGGSLLVGNLGDGRLNAFNLNSGSFQGTLQDSTGVALSIPGLWGLHFGAAASGAEVAGRLYFAAGIQDETHGLFGYLSPVTAGGGGGGGGQPACDNQARGLGFWRQQCGHGPSAQDANFPPGKALGWSKDNQGQAGENQRGGQGRGPHGIFGRGDISADSLNALLACVSTSSAAFGTEGCFTANCELLSAVGKRSNRDQAAQQLLTLRLNLCSGLVCDSLSGCHGGRGATLTAGEVADSLDFLLCHGGSDADLAAMASLADCFNNSGHGGGNGNGLSHRNDDRDRVTAPTIGVQTLGSIGRLGGDPVRMSVSTSTPAIVQFRIYDAAGRLVAQPLRNALVSGSVEVKWDGRGMRGELVPPGNYFYRATAGNEASTGHIVIMR